MFVEDRNYPYAYTFRDYVIRSFNDDLPYDRFILDQLAADKLDTSKDKRRLAAMGFTTLGRRFLNAQPDIIDDRIDVVSRTFLGLTVTCARCHDHKFDPIPTKDYYSLYGVFASSTEPKELPLLELPADTPEVRAFDAELKKREKEAAAAWDKLRADHAGRPADQGGRRGLSARGARRPWQARAGVRPDGHGTRTVPLRRGPLEAVLGRAGQEARPGLRPSTTPSPPSPTRTSPPRPPTN